MGDRATEEGFAARRLEEGLPEWQAAGLAVAPHLTIAQAEEPACRTDLWVAGGGHRDRQRATGGALTGP